MVQSTTRAIYFPKKDTYGGVSGTCLAAVRIEHVEILTRVTPGNQ